MLAHAMEPYDYFYPNGYPAPEAAHRESYSTFQGQNSPESITSQDYDDELTDDQGL